MDRTIDLDRAASPSVFTTEADRRSRARLWLGCLGCCSALLLGVRAQAAEVTGELKTWHRVTVTFDGPSTGEGASPNPFLDYRLEVIFAQGGLSYRVPGFFAADGNAEDTGATSGNKWRVHFVPDREGTWTYTASFRSGTDVAVDLDPGAGSPADFDGATGSFDVSPSDKTGRDLRSKGTLRYVGDHHLQFAETGEYYLKGGADSPENFLGYFEFDGTYDTGGISTPGLIDGLHRFAPHVTHWNEGDPTWQGGKGKAIIGALNYLGGKGINSVYFLTYNIDGGDGADTWPWTSHTERERFDCSKLDQWEIVFAHMDRVGIQLHVVTQETENDHNLGGNGSLNRLRKLYYRELVARFSQHLAVIWNLGEENSNSDAERRAFADYIRALDPYDHPITVHTNFNSGPGFYNGLYGDLNFEATSLQGSGTNYNGWAISIRQLSSDAGRPWAVYGDEQGPAVDDQLDNLNELRQNTLWGNLMGGGAGVEWYFGYQNTFGDVQSEDWTATAALWDQTHHAVEFFQSHLPFHTMEPRNDLVSTGFCLAQPGETYAVYLPSGGSTTLTLPSGDYDVRWYDPELGGALKTGTVASVTGPGQLSIGTAPFPGDAAALITRSGQPDGLQAVAVAVPSEITLPTNQILLDGSASSGDIVGFAWEQLGGPTATIQAPSTATTLVTGLVEGLHDFQLTVTDSQSQSDSTLVTVIVHPEGPASPSVTDLVLVDADTDEDIGPLADGQVLDLATLPTPNLNIRADTAPAVVGSVRFALDGNPEFSTENTAPYALAGDSGGDYNPWTPGLGAHTLTATPFSGINAGGQPGMPLTVTFEVTDGPGAAVPAPPGNLQAH